MFVKIVSTRYYMDMSKDTNAAHELIERLGNLIRADGRTVCNEYGMRPVQLEALGYLSQCNRYSDTPQAVAEFLGLTKGTVSQTLNVLEQKGLVRKQGDTKDKRIVHLKPTAKGLRLVNRALPSTSLALGFAKLSKTESQVAVEQLRLILHSVQIANGLKTFATCHSCRFNMQREDGFICQLTQERLSESDITLLCREHQYPTVIAS